MEGIFRCDREMHIFWEHQQRGRYPQWGNQGPKGVERRLFFSLSQGQALRRTQTQEFHCSQSQTEQFRFIRSETEQFKCSQSKTEQFRFVYNESSEPYFTLA
jgi:hypothetical protein